MKLALDTNLYVRAFRDLGAAAELEGFHESHAPHLYLCSVVLHEMEVGGASPLAARWMARTARPFTATRRVVTPSHAAWRDAGSAINRLALAHRIDRRTVSRSLVNDFLIAATCRESGVTLVTDNTRDFTTIQSVLPFDFVAPWP